MAAEKTCEFDKLCSTDEICILKILTFYLDKPLKDMLTIYILFLQIQTYLNQSRKSCGASSGGDVSPHYFFEEIEPYCNSNASLKQFLSTARQVENLRDIMEFLNSMQELSKDGGSPFSDVFQGAADLNGVQDIMDLFQMMGAAPTGG